MKPSPEKRGARYPTEGRKAQFGRKWQGKCGFRCGLEDAESGACEASKNSGCPPDAVVRK